MSTGIQWTDETWNPVTGCTKVSPGCKHCYAEMVADRFWGTQYPPVGARPRQFTDVQTHDDRLDQPLRWKKPRRVFVNSMSDLFHEAVSDEFISHVFAIMALAPRHTFQILTKRAERMCQYLQEMSSDPDAYCFAWAQNYERGDLQVTPSLLSERWPLSNVWLGVSVEDQSYADMRIPLLLQTPAAVRFLSVEPLLGPIHLHESVFRCCHSEKCDESVFGIDWVIVGGESGLGARPMDLAWVRSIVGQCQAASVPCFVKQLGAKPESVIDHISHRGSVSQKPDGFYRFLNDSKGGDPSEWPKDLRVREFPRLEPVA